MILTQLAILQKTVPIIVDKSSQLMKLKNNFTFQFIHSTYPNQCFKLHFNDFLSI